MPLLAVENLRKSYGDHLAVDGLSFDLSPGEVLGLLGPNGAGKTTTMMMIVGLLEPDGGNVLIDGEVFSPRRLDLKRRLGIVPQELAIYPELTATDNLKFFGGLYGLHGSDLKQRMATVLQQVGLTDVADNKVGTYSGGMKRRLNFAVAVLHSPQVLILDEPTVGVDPQSRSHLLECVRTLAAENVAVIYASHYMEEVEAICDRVIIIDHGKMLTSGTIDGLLDDVEPQLTLHVAGVNGTLDQRLGGLAVIRDRSGHDVSIQVQAGGERLNSVLSQVLTIIDDEGGEVRRIDSQEASLERLFLRLTGQGLRD